MKKKETCKEYLQVSHRILLGSLMFITGLMKLIVSGPTGVAKMFEGFGFPLPLLFAWGLILVEIVAGGLFMVNKQKKVTGVLLAGVLIVAALMVHLQDHIRVWLHLIVALDYIMVAYKK